MTHQSATPRYSSREQRLLWYPDAAASHLTPQTIEAAMRHGRRERAEMLSAMVRGAGRLLTRAGGAVGRGITLVQQRRARNSLARYRVQPIVSAHFELARAGAAVPPVQLQGRPGSGDHGRRDDSTPPPKLAA